MSQEDKGVVREPKPVGIGTVSCVILNSDRNTFISGYESRFENESFLRADK